MAQTSKLAQAIKASFGLIGTGLQLLNTSADMAIALADGTTTTVNELRENGLGLAEAGKIVVTQIIQFAQPVNVVLNDASAYQLAKSILLLLLPQQSQVVKNHETFASQAKHLPEALSKAYAQFEEEGYGPTKDAENPLATLEKLTADFAKTSAGLKNIVAGYKKAPVNTLFSCALVGVHSVAPNKFPKVLAEHELYKFLQELVQKTPSANINDYTDEVIHNSLCQVTSLLFTAYALTGALAQQTVPSVKLSRSTDVVFKTFDKTSRDEAKAFPAVVYPAKDATFDVVFKKLVDQFFYSKSLF